MSACEEHPYFSTHQIPNVQNLFNIVILPVFVES